MEKYIAHVSVTIEISASSPTVAMAKAAKKLGGHFINQIDIYNADGSEAGSIQPGPPIGSRA